MEEEEEVLKKQIKWMNNHHEKEKIRVNEMEKEDVVLKEQTKPRGFLDKERTRMDKIPLDLELNYFISYVGSKLPTRTRDAANLFFHGLIRKHPLNYIIDLNIRNQEKKGFNRVFNGFTLISWQEISEYDWKKYEELRINEIDEL